MLNGLVKFAAFTSPILLLALLYSMHQNTLLKADIDRLMQQNDNDAAVVQRHVLKSMGDKEGSAYFDKQLKKGEAKLDDLERKQKEAEAEASKFDRDVHKAATDASSDMEKEIGKKK